MIYDTYYRKFVTALPSRKFFRKLKLLEIDKKAILDGTQTVFIHVPDNSFSMKPGRYVDLYLGRSSKPFARITIKTTKSKKVFELPNLDNGIDIQTTDDALKYVRDRYGGKVVGDTKVRVGYFKLSNTF